MADRAQVALLDLPPDVVRHILKFLGVRSLLCVASTCRTLRTAADALPLHPVMTSQTDMLPWLQRPGVAARVRSLVARNCLWGRCAWVRQLPALQRLVAAFGRVRAPLCRHLPPTLRHLDLHRLDCDPGDVFSTTRLTALTNLHTLKLTFTPRWDLVVVDALASLPALQHVSMRLAPTLVVRAPVSVPRVQLQAVQALVSPHAISAADLTLECTETAVPVDVVITPATAPRLRRLALSCPRRVTVPCLEHMTRLESLRLRLDSALVPLGQLPPTLRALCIDTRFGVAVAGTHARLSEGVDVRASVAGVPMPQASIQSMFFTR